MGIIDKIEDKLSGSNKHGDQSKAEKQAMKEGRSSYENSTSHGHGSQGYGNEGYGKEGYGKEGYGKEGYGNDSYGSGTGSHGTHGMSGGAGGYGSKTQHLQNPVSSGTKGSMADQYDRRAAAGTGEYGAGAPSNYPTNDGYGSQSGRDKMLPSEPMDPYSSKGQRAAAAAGVGGAGYGSRDGRTSEQDYAGRDSDVSRSHHGGIMNSTGDNYSHGGRSNENHHAIPTAGGEKLGSGGQGMSSSGGHHYGRDAGLAGGAGAAGLGAYEMGKNHREDGSSGRHGHHSGAEPVMGSSGGYSSRTDPRSGDMSYPQGTLDRQNPEDVSYMKTGSHGHHGHHEPHGSHMGGASGLNEGTSDRSGLPTEKKLGGAYEAGYRDAMAHIEAEQGRR